jgi:riboflavin synthase
VIRFSCGEILDDLELGHSVSVDGVCLTVAGKFHNSVSVEATPETLRKSNLGSRRVGDQLNLEPALRSFDFLGGHLVQGHVDATGTVESIRTEGNSWVFRISVPPEVARYCVKKGSVTLNGISLTISGLEEEYFEVTIIPHTMEVTNMSDLKPGASVNLEADVISKYVESHVKRCLGRENDRDRAASVGEQ